MNAFFPLDLKYNTLNLESEFFLVVDCYTISALLFRENRETERDSLPTVEI